MPAGTYSAMRDNGRKTYAALQYFVPGHEGVMIHSGNVPDNSQGCTLLSGSFVGPDHLAGGSRATIDALRSYLDHVDRTDGAPKIQVIVNDIQKH